MRLLFSLLLTLLTTSGLAHAADPADWVIQARYVLTMNAQHAVIPDGAVAIQGSRILAVGTQEEISRRFQAKHTLDTSDSLIAPGLIDTHTQAPMACFARSLMTRGWKIG
ncbi:MAG: hypothetical protein JO033_20455 [Acidobacteriaceae bacterium]|nr:hypothetical protein [Acidobacteriaceae bacterium]MBV9499810.1 hypothetical protein [Acidobacteriaceae bacterium]